MGEGDDLLAKLLQMAQNQGASQGDPLNLSNSDYPSMSLTTIPFDGTNFVAWNRQIRMAQGSKLKLGFIDGTILRSQEGSIDASRWERADRMVACWVLNSMTAEVSGSFVYVDSAFTLWKEVLERYSQSNAPLVYQLKQELMRVTQGNLSITSYYTKLKKCWDELQFMSGIPACSCGFLSKCTCEDMAKMVELEDRDRLMHFLVNLNSEYDSFKSQILSQDPLPKLNRAYYLLLHVEKQKQISSTVPESVAFSVNARNYYNAGQKTNGSESKAENSERKDYKKGKQNSKKHCSHCNMNGHVKEECFEIVGYPDWYKGKRKENGVPIVAGQVMNDVHQQGTPLDGESGGQQSKIDLETMYAMCQEMMKMFKGKMVMPSSVNFAGPYE